MSISSLRGQGILHVASSLHGDLGNPITFEQWHTALLLPAHYEVLAVQDPTVDARWFALTVASTDIPVGKNIAVKPVYTRQIEEQTGIYATKLLKINLSEYTPVSEIVRLREAIMQLANPETSPFVLGGNE